MLVEGIYNAMLNDPALNGLVAGRVTPSPLPKDPVLPAITFFEISDTTEVCLDGVALTSTNIEVDVWAKSYLEVKRGQKMLHDLFDGFVGTLSEGTRVLVTTSHNNPDFYEKDSLYHRSSTTFTFLT